MSVNTGFLPACLRLKYMFKYIHTGFTTTTVFCFTPCGGRLNQFEDKSGVAQPFVWVCCILIQTLKSRLQ